MDICNSEQPHSDKRLNISLLGQKNQHDLDIREESVHACSGMLLIAFGQKTKLFFAHMTTSAHIFV